MSEERARYDCQKDQKVAGPPNRLTMVDPPAVYDCQKDKKVVWPMGQPAMIDIIGDYECQRQPPENSPEPPLDTLNLNPLLPEPETTSEKPS